MSATRTRPDAASTGLGGSSLGGLISSYAGVRRADTFALVGAMSPSTWWANTWLLGEVAMTPASPRPLRVYVDSGDAGPSNDDVDNTRMLAAAYRAIGYSDGATLDYFVQGGAQHNEYFWAQRLPRAADLRPRALLEADRPDREHPDRDGPGRRDRTPTGGSRFPGRLRPSQQAVPR